MSQFTTCLSPAITADKNKMIYTPTSKAVEADTTAPGDSLAISAEAKEKAKAAETREEKRKIMMAARKKVHDDVLTLFVVSQ